MLCVTKTILNANNDFFAPFIQRSVDPWRQCWSGV